tara:strand:- start:214 stop:444 length:231 start_codon:yes stop_codon:yes gene_type:complete
VLRSTEPAFKDGQAAVQGAKSFNEKGRNRFELQRTDAKTAFSDYFWEYKLHLLGNESKMSLFVEPRIAPPLKAHAI